MMTHTKIGALARVLFGFWCFFTAAINEHFGKHLLRSEHPGVICVAGVALGALQGVGCTPWRSVGSAALPV